MPAYGGSLLDPARFPWLTATDERGLRLRVSDRVMLHVLESVQTPSSRASARRISFRDVDVEQIGYIYEGLLGYTCGSVDDDVVLGLVGKDGEEPEIEARHARTIYDDAPRRQGVRRGAARVDQGGPAGGQADARPPSWRSSTTRRSTRPSYGGCSPRSRRMTPNCSDFLIAGATASAGTSEASRCVVPPAAWWSSRPRRGRTPAPTTRRGRWPKRSCCTRSQPLVYEPGPLQTNDENEWKLKSSTAILDLKVADIAAGSGAFLVAAARYLADRVTEAWIDEGMSVDEERAEAAARRGPGHP